ncbi:hypothetical protein AB0K60_01315 [Thermopolyspora sp. NPDC052614]|uniref:hypothetical protein n=1 Tax=Thermopolyspora sp. NPDC052614 TaxID=3155682 RepID=UPI00341E6EE8
MPLREDDLDERARSADPDDEFLLSEVSHAHGLASLADSLIEAAWDVRQAFEWFMAQRERLGAADLYAQAVKPELAEMIAGLSGAAEHAAHAISVTVADPSAGPGDLLAAVAGQLGEECLPSFHATDPDSYLSRLLRRRLIVSGVEPDEIALGDDLIENAEIVVTQIPYRPGEERSPIVALEAVDDVYVRLPLDATAVILGPADALTGPLKPRSDAANLRDKLLASGVVEAIIRLPGGLVPFRPGYETALWVLRRGGEQSKRVLVADISDQTLTPELSKILIEDVVTWRRPGYNPDARSRELAWPVQVAELTGDAGQGGFLVRKPRPSARQVLEVVPARIARAHHIEAELSQLALRDRSPIHGNLSQRRTRPRTTATIAQLIDLGGLRVINGSRGLPSSPMTEHGRYRVVGVPELTGEDRGLGVDWTRVLGGDKGVADRLRRRRTRPGDVIVTTSPRLAVHIDHEGNSMAEFPARVLRIHRNERQLTPHVLAALLSHAPATERSAGAVRARKLEDIEIPLLPPEEVTSLDALLREMDRRRRTAQAELDALDELGRIILTGLGDGTMMLTPRSQIATP